LNLGSCNFNRTIAPYLYRYCGYSFNKKRRKTGAKYNGLLADSRLAREAVITRAKHGDQYVFRKLIEKNIRHVAVAEAQVTAIDCSVINSSTESLFSPVLAQPDPLYRWASHAFPAATPALP